MSMYSEMIFTWGNRIWPQFHGTSVLRLYVTNCISLFPLVQNAAETQKCACRSALADNPDSQENSASAHEEGNVLHVGLCILRSKHKHTGQEKRIFFLLRCKLKDWTREKKVLGQDGWIEAASVWSSVHDSGNLMIQETEQYTLFNRKKEKKTQKFQVWIEQ